MTNREIFCQILSLATGEPRETFETSVELTQLLAGTNTNFDQELPDDEAEALLTKLRRELPGIRAWVEEGRRRASFGQARTPEPRRAPATTRTNPGLQLPRLNKGFRA